MEITRVPFNTKLEKEYRGIISSVKRQTYTPEKTDDNKNPVPIHLFSLVVHMTDRRGNKLDRKITIMNDKLEGAIMAALAIRELVRYLEPEQVAERLANNRFIRPVQQGGGWTSSVSFTFETGRYVFAPRGFDAHRTYLKIKTHRDKKFKVNMGYLIKDHPKNNLMWSKRGQPGWVRTVMTPVRWALLNALLIMQSGGEKILGGKLGFMAGFANGALKIAGKWIPGIHLQTTEKQAEDITEYYKKVQPDLVLNRN